MVSADEVITQVRQAFTDNSYPGDQFLQGSFEGCEPYDEVGAFVDPLFHLCHGFSSFTTEVPVESATFHRSSGGDVLLNPRRYGAMTWRDHARQRLSAFTREEAAAVVAYLQYQRQQDHREFDRPRIDDALQDFWLGRAASAPSRQSLEEHQRREDEFAAALRRRITDQPQ